MTELEERWYDKEIEVVQHFERDRAFVGIQEVDTGEYLAEWWDEDVGQLVEDGFLKLARVPFGPEPIDPGSVIEYADHLGISAYVER